MLWLMIVWGILTLLGILQFMGVWRANIKTYRRIRRACLDPTDSDLKKLLVTGTIMLTAKDYGLQFNRAMASCVLANDVAGVLRCANQALGLWRGEPSSIAPDPPAPTVNDVVDLKPGDPDGRPNV